jgi:hypothetical protein
VDRAPRPTYFPPRANAAIAARFRKEIPNADGKSMSHSTNGLSISPGLVRYRTRRAFSTAARAVRSAIFVMAPIVGWATLAIFLGAVVGLSAVILPPMGAFAIPVMASLVLLWALPELPAVPARAVRALFPIVLVVDLCVPVYYAIAGTGLPWISIRRIVTFPLIVCMALLVAGSSAARAQIAQRLVAGKLISTCAIGYLVMMALSVLNSESRPESISYILDAVLIWFLPFFTIIYLTSDEREIDNFIKTIAWCAVFISVCGVVEFPLQRNIFVAILPKPILDALMENSPTFAAMATTNMYHNGQYRAPSVFENALSFGQFEAMIIPFGYYFLVHRPRGDRWLGLLVVASGLLGIITSGSRGAFVSILVATPAFVALWLIRTVRFKPRSLAPALVGVAGVMGFAALIILIFTWLRLYNMVIGSHADDQGSSQARWDQWHMAIPHILNHPLVGNGTGTGGTVVGYFNPGAQFPTLDSMIVSTLVETGVPGLLFFYGSLIFAIVLGARKYLEDSGGRGAFAGGLSCSLIAFLVYTTVLTQVENFTIMYLFLGLTIALLSLDRQPEKEPTLRDDGRRARRTVNHDREAGAAPRAAHRGGGR